MWGKAAVSFAICTVFKGSMVLTSSQRIGAFMYASLTSFKVNKLHHNESQAHTVS